MGCSSCGSRSVRPLVGISNRFMRDGRIILLTTFRKQRNNERAEVARARKVAEDCAKRFP
jgi:hypothetical protein